MKKLIIFTSCFVLSCVIFSFVILPNFIKPQAIDNSESETGTSLTYIVKNFNGNIGVFEEGSSIPFKTYDVPVDSLPYKDQRNLEKGIAISSKSELNKMIEDLCS